MVWICFFFTKNILLAELQDDITCIVEDLLFYNAEPKNHIRGSDEVLESDFWLRLTFKHWYNNKYRMIWIKELPIVYYEKQF